MYQSTEQAAGPSSDTQALLLDRESQRGSGPVAVHVPQPPPVQAAGPIQPIPPTGQPPVQGAAPSGSPPMQAAAPRSTIPETPTRPPLPLMEAVLIESSGEEWNAIPVTPPRSPARLHPLHMAVCPRSRGRSRSHPRSTGSMTAQVPPTIPKLSERYRESIGSDSEHEREWYAIMPKC